MPWWKPKRPATRARRVAGDRLRGAILGGALADALAFVHEGRPPGPIGELSVGEVSDDTQLTLATALAVVSAGGVPQPEALAEQLLAWHREHGYTGIGAATAKAIRELSVGGHWALVGRKGEMAAGNGPAVRVAPLTFVLDLADRRDRQRLRDLCRITHHSDEAYVGALAVALSIQEATDGRWSGRTALFERLAGGLPDTAVRDRLVEVGDHEDATVAELAARLGSSGYVVESVPLAIHAFCSKAEGSYVEMVKEIVEAGGDCDSIASIAGQCFGGATRSACPAGRAARPAPQDRPPRVERTSRLLGLSGCRVCTS